MAQHEAGKEAVACVKLPPEVLAAALKEHVEAAARYALMLDYMEALTAGKVEPKLLVGATPEELTT